MYDKKPALYYDYFAVKDDIPFFRRLMLRLGGPVLDLGSGTGPITLDLAGAGMTVVGVDSSRHMLEIARSKQDKLSPSVRERLKFVEGDMIDFPYNGKFASAIAARGSFAYLLSSEEQLRCLTNVGNLLEVGGKIVLDLYPPSPEQVAGGTSISRTITVDGDIKLLRTIHTRSDLNKQKCYYTIIYQQYKGGILLEQVLEESVISLLFPREVLLLLRQSGFAVEEVYGDTTGGEFSSASRRMIVVASKE